MMEINAVLISRKVTGLHFMSIICSVSELWQVFYVRDSARYPALEETPSGFWVVSGERIEKLDWD